MSEVQSIEQPTSTPHASALALAEVAKRVGGIARVARVALYGQMEGVLGRSDLAELLAAEADVAQLCRMAFHLTEESNRDGLDYDKQGGWNQLEALLGACSEVLRLRDGSETEHLSRMHWCADLLDVAAARATALRGSTAMAEAPSPRVIAGRGGEQNLRRLDAARHALRAVAEDWRHAAPWVAEDCADVVDRIDRLSGDLAGALGEKLSA